MGGEGSIQSMINTLRNNKALLKPRLKIYQKEHPFGKRKRKIQRAKTKVGLKDKPLSHVERERIKIAVRSSYRRETLQQLSLTFALLSLMVLGVFKWSQTQTQRRNELKEIRVRSEMELRSKNYREALLRADELMNAKRWNPAISEYRAALAIRPNSPSLAYKMCLAYCLQCEAEHRYCNLAKEELRLQLQSFPEDEELLGLQQNYFGAK